MVAFSMKTRLKPDGALDLHIATGLPESEVDVLVVVQPIGEAATLWPAGFFTETYGAFWGFSVGAPAPSPVRV
jgi:hypothetical protein